MSAFVLLRPASSNFVHFVHFVPLSIFVRLPPGPRLSASRASPSISPSCRMLVIHACLQTLLLHVLPLSSVPSSRCAGSGKSEGRRVAHNHTEGGEEQGPPDNRHRLTITQPHQQTNPVATIAHIPARRPLPLELSSVAPARLIPSWRAPRPFPSGARPRQLGAAWPAPRRAPPTCARPSPPRAWPWLGCARVRSWRSDQERAERHDREEAEDEEFFGRGGGRASTSPKTSQNH